MSVTDASLGMLEALYDAYHRQAMGLAFQLLGDVPDAEEVVQDAFVAAWRAAASYDPARGSTRAWLLTMVRSRALDRLRARRRTASSPLEGLPEPEDAMDVFAEVAADEEGQVAREALVRLPPEQRQVIELAYFAGLSHAEIAARIAVPLGTVKSRIRLALDRLRLVLDAPAGQRLHRL